MASVGSVAGQDARLGLVPVDAAASRVRRIVAGILFADGAAYSKVMDRNEQAGRAQLLMARKLFAGVFDAHGGRMCGVSGDSLIGCFSSAVDAVEAAVRAQDDLAAIVADYPSELRLLWRIGIHYGDVMEEGADLVGDAVNVAARLQQLAPPGGLCMSGVVYDLTRKQLPLQMRTLGPCRLKNIAEPVVAHVTLGAAARRFGPQRARLGKSLLAMAAAVSSVVAVGVMVGNLAPNLWWPISTDRSLAAERARDEGRPSVAVLPINNLTGDESRDLVAYAATLEVHQVLAGQLALRVISSDSAESMLAEKLTPRALADRYGIGYVVRGGVVGSNIAPKLNLELLSAVSGDIVWADSIELRSPKVLVLPGQILQRMLVKFSEAAGTSLGGQMMYAHLADERINMSAFQDWITGMGLMFENKADLNGQSRTYFQKAMKTDPSFGRAYLYHSYSYLKEWTNNWSTASDKSREKALELAEEAVNLFPNGHYGYWARALALLWSDRIDDALIDYQHALELSPNDPVLLADMGDALVADGRPREAILQIEKAMARSPSNAWWYSWNLAYAQLFDGRYDDAIKTIESIPEQSNDLKIVLAVAYVQRGGPSDLDTAQRLISEFVANDNRFTLAEASRQPFRQAKDRETWLGGLRRAGLPEGPAAPLP